jgi:hypothetical protein
MKISFDDQSYIELTKLNDKVVIIIQAKDPNSSLKKINNEVHLTLDEFKKLTSEI